MVTQRHPPFPHKTWFKGNTVTGKAAHGDSTASPLPPLMRQHVNLCDEKPRECDAIFWLCCNHGTLSRIKKEVKCYLCLAV